VAYYWKLYEYNLIFVNTKIAMIVINMIIIGNNYNNNIEYNNNSNNNSNNN